MAQNTRVVLEAFAPSRKSYDADVLKYKNLRKTIELYALTAFLKKNSLRLLTKKKSPSIDELKHDFHIASILNASYRLQKSLTPIDKYVWSKVFTSSSVRLFGRPSKREIAKLARAELSILENMSNSIGHNEFTEPVLTVYKSLVGDKVSKTDLSHQTYPFLMQDIRTYFETEYQEVFACFDNYPSTHNFAPTDIVNVFSDALEMLAKTDKSWAKWKIELDDSAHLSVNVDQKLVIVGAYRAVIDHQHIKGLFAHEVLVHAQRALNGAKISKKLASGMTDYLVAEEGFGVLVESSINSEIPEKIIDRYIDIALALGSRWRPGISREEMYNFCYKRSVIRSVARGEDIDLDGLEKTTWEHVNRIYRGSLGNKYIGVFTKDIAYYKGFKKLAKHFEKSRKKGTLHSQIRFALQGKFDPTS